jgi:hypothetical protein
MARPPLGRQPPRPRHVPAVEEAEHAPLDGVVRHRLVPFLAVWPAYKIPYRQWSCGMMYRNPSGWHRPPRPHRVVRSVRVGRLAHLQYTVQPGGVRHDVPQLGRSAHAWAPGAASLPWAYGRMKTRARMALQKPTLVGVGIPYSDIRRPVRASSHGYRAVYDAVATCSPRRPVSKDLPSMYKVEVRGPGA